MKKELLEDLKEELKKNMTRDYMLLHTAVNLGIRLYKYILKRYEYKS